MRARARTRIRRAHPARSSDPLYGDPDLLLQWDSRNRQESAGTILRLNDESGNGRHALADGTCLVTTETWRGVESLLFTGDQGAGHRFTCASDAELDALEDGAGLWSIVLIGRWEEVWPTEYRTLIAKRPNWSNGAQGLYFTQTGGGQPDFRAGWNFNGHDFYDEPYTGDFFVIVNASAAAGYQLYEDGQAYETPTFGTASWSDTAAPLQLGGVLWGDTATSGFKGNWSHVRLYKRNLTAPEIAALTGYVHGVWGSSDWQMSGE